ncbi:tRNA-histidine guanylyltransferase 1-like [Gonapodya sp. JEL0774]|nr:tRNA-histidine guanylyltransferase 1-like [Gonapodya sp. JEL0774]
MAKSKYEYVRSFELPDPILPNLWIVVRVDGRGFGPFTKKHGFTKPLDLRGIRLMNEAAEGVMREFSGEVILAFGESDEFSFLIRRTTDLYNRRSGKIVSTIVSVFTAQYIWRWDRIFGTGLGEQCNGGEVGVIGPNCGTDGTEQEFPSKPAGASNGGFLFASSDNQAPQNVHRKPFVNLVVNPDSVVPPRPLYPPSFDARAVTYPTMKEVQDYFRWRQVDTHINALYNTCYHLLVTQPVVPGFKFPSTTIQSTPKLTFIFPPDPPRSLTPSEAEQLLSQTDSSLKNELLFRGFGLNYNDLPAATRKGSILLWKKSVRAKGRRKAEIAVEHVDLIGDSFWSDCGVLLDAES